MNNRPKRIQRKRTKGWRMPPNAVYVGRPSRWGNPFVIGEWQFQRLPAYVVRTPDQAVSLFREWLFDDSDTRDCDRHMIRKKLAGRNLACWCSLDQACHADVLLELANSTGQQVSATPTNDELTVSDADAKSKG